MGTNRIRLGKKYIYNPYQKNFYIDNGALLLGNGFNQKTNKEYWIFDFNSTIIPYRLWCEKVH